MVARFLSVFLIAIALSACSAHDEGGALLTGSIQPSDERPSDDPLVAGRLYFEKGSYGQAERQFRAATEANPHSTDAWLGLAASYDRLARFELAERAYERVVKVAGETPAVLNNLGYHHMLRGNLRVARAKLEEASRRDPKNPLI